MNSMIKKYLGKTTIFLEKKLEVYFWDRKEKEALDLELINSFIKDFSIMDGIVVEKITYMGSVSHDDFCLFQKKVWEWEKLVESKIFQDNSKESEVKKTLIKLDAFKSRFSKETEGNINGYIGFTDIKYTNHQRYYKALDELSNIRQEFIEELEKLIENYNKRIRLFMKLGLIEE